MISHVATHITIYKLPKLQVTVERSEFEVSSIFRAVKPQRVGIHEDISHITSTQAVSNLINLVFISSIPVESFMSSYPNQRKLTNQVASQPASPSSPSQGSPQATYRLDHLLRQTGTKRFNANRPPLMPNPSTTCVDACMMNSFKPSGIMRPPSQCANSSSSPHLPVSRKGRKPYELQLQQEWHDWTGVQ